MCLACIETRDLYSCKPGFGSQSSVGNAQLSVLQECSQKPFLAMVKPSLTECEKESFIAELGKQTAASGFSSEILAKATTPKYYTDNGDESPLQSLPFRASPSERGSIQN